MIDEGPKTGSDAEYAGGIEAYALDFFDAAEGAPRHSSPVGSPAQNWVFTALTKCQGGPIFKRSALRAA